MAADDLFQQLTHIGSALGPVGLMVTGFLNRTIKNITTDIKSAKKLGTEAMKVAGEAKTTATEAKSALQAFTQQLADAARSSAEASRVAGEARTLAQDRVAQSQALAPSGGPGASEIRKIYTAFDELRRGLRLEVTTFRSGLDERFAQLNQELRSLVRQLTEEAERRLDRDLERVMRGSRPDGFESDSILVEMRSKLLHEQEQRVALQQNLAAHMKEAVDRWLKMERFIGSIETTVETWQRDRDSWKSERDEMNEKIESMRRELRDRNRSPR